MNHPINYISILIAFLLLPFFAFAQTEKKTFVHPKETNSLEVPLPTKEKIETLFLIGDAGDKVIIEEGQPALFAHLEKELEKAGVNSSIVFLGDNVYPAGLPKKEEDDRQLAESILNAQLDILKNHEGKSYFIPGNHDWNHWKKGGLKAVKRQEHYIQDYYPEKKVKFYPNHGCGDPVVKKIQKDLYYVFIDTQWWLHNWHKEDEINNGCDIKSRQEFLQVLQEIFLKHKNDQIVVLLHHPFFSNGEHNGKFSAKTHVFPLTMANEKLFIPLPILGSCVPLERGLGGTIQDIPHPLYQELIDGVMGMLRQNKNVIFASGHEHSLQYFLEKGHHFIVSGSGSKNNFAKRGGKARMVRSTKGYSQLHFYKNGEVWMDFYKVDETKPEGELIFRKQIVPPKAGTVDTGNTYPSASSFQDSITFAANKNFAAKKVHRFFMGKQYRDIWSKEIEVPILDLATEKGGLTPIKKGGGMASNSLRLETEDGSHYALRSILKDYRKLAGPEFANLKALSILTDMTSCGNPYAPLTLPTLSKAAGIYYTIPKLVYLKRQEGMGLYNDLFNEELYLLEDRPSGNRSNSPHLGNSKKIISYLDLIEEQRKDHLIKIDQEWTLRSRLFDILIHDWDRHDDQWRWAKFEENGETIYRPIPRDRDQAFYKFEGILPFFTAMYVMKKFIGFKKDLKTVKWQSFNARYFDRYFLNDLDKEDWDKQIDQLKNNLTDGIIDEAMTKFPEGLDTQYQEEIGMKLKSRRDNLSKIGQKLYRYISKYVSVPGSNENERFDVERLSNGNVHVQVFALSKKGKKEQKIYDRIFVKKETKEIRLYGLGGKDQFNLTGKGKKTIKVRVIGGFGKDVVQDQSHGGIRKMTKVYDEPEGIEIQSEGEVRDLTNNRLNENEYNRTDHLYDQNLVVPSFGYTPDDKFWLGLSYTRTKHGFRKEPYKNKQVFNTSFSPSSRSAFHLGYQGDFRNVLFNFFDFEMNLQLDNPFYTNYFGLGNQTSKTSEELKFNWVRMRQYDAEALVKKSSRSDYFHFKIGPKYKSYSVKNVAGRVVDDPTFGISTEDQDWRHYVGGTSRFEIENVDSRSFPKEGIDINLGASYLSNIENEEQIALFNAEQIFYITFGSRFATTLASRTGWSKTIGDLQFYQYPSIGNNNYLRGYRNDRFRGDQIFYQNIDLRIRLGNWNNTILPMEIGLIGGYDVGKVWLNKATSKAHHSFTAGIWFNVLSAIVLQPHMAFSKEEKQFSFKVGFNF